MHDIEYEAMIFQRIASAPGSARDIEKAQAAQWWASVAKGKRSAFDFEGVSEHLRTVTQLSRFLEGVTGQGVTPYLRVDQQAELARRIVDAAKKTDHEVSGRFIYEYIVNTILPPFYPARRETPEEKLQARSKLYQRQMSRSLRGMTGALIRMREVQKDWPLETLRPVTSEFREALRTASEMINALDARI